ncbi:MAG: hypothetical protein OHK0048_17810 [Rhodoferax sp.]
MCAQWAITPVRHAGVCLALASALGTPYAAVPPETCGGSGAQAVSADGQWRLSVASGGGSLILQDALGMHHARWDFPERDSAAQQQPAHQPVLLRDHAQRRSFVVAFGGARELWEISYDRKAAPIFDGWVHDYQFNEGVARPGFLGVRKTRLTQALDDFCLDAQSPHVLGVARWQTQAQAQGTPSTAPELWVINLDIRRARAHWPLTLRAPVGAASHALSALPNKIPLYWQDQATPDGARWLRWQHGDRSGCVDMQRWTAAACP